MSAIHALAGAAAPTVAVFAPAPELSGLVAGYWYVNDAVGAFADARTAPHPAAVLTVHRGTLARTMEGAEIPRLSLFGLQSANRVWRGGPGTCFAMAMITAAGLAELFPGDGRALYDRLAAVEDVTGARAARVLHSSTESADASSTVRALESWLLARRARVGQWRRHRRFAAALAELRSSGRVDAAASSAAVSVRHLQRWTRLHAGVTPKQLYDLERLQRSLRRAQLNQTVHDGSYTDESHLIRAWRRRLATTPGRYRRSDVSALARSFAAAQPRDESFVAHYL